MPPVTPHTEMFNDLLKLAVDSGVSDVIIKSNKPGYVRIAGKLKAVDMDPILCPEAEAWVCEPVPRIFPSKLDDEGQVDFAHAAGADYATILNSVRRIIRGAVGERNGTVIDAHGDEMFAAFPSLDDAVGAAVEVQRGLIDETWPGEHDVRRGHDTDYTQGVYVE